jgi:hypothetical protein
MGHDVFHSNNNKKQSQRRPKPKNNAKPKHLPVAAAAAFTTASDSPATHTLLPQSKPPGPPVQLPATTPKAQHFPKVPQ